SSADEKKRQAEAEAQRAADAAKIAVDREIERRRVLLEQIAKDLLKRRKAEDDAGRLAEARSWHHRVQSFFNSAVKQLAQPNLDESIASGMLRECEHLNLELRAAMAAQTSVSTSPAK
ncbi:MAG TPA: hypothetical protein V6D23_26510, partial [Candidatus Obscuribacterales bacterium]